MELSVIGMSATYVALIIYISSCINIALHNAYTASIRQIYTIPMSRSTSYTNNML